MNGLSVEEIIQMARSIAFQMKRHSHQEFYPWTLEQMMDMAESFVLNTPQSSTYPFEMTGEEFARALNAHFDRLINKASFHRCKSFYSLN